MSFVHQKVFFYYHLTPIIDQKIACEFHNTEPQIQKVILWSKTSYKR